VTAQDFVDDWNYVTDPGNQSYVAYILAPVAGTDVAGYAMRGLTGVTALDRYTLRVTLKYPFAELPQVLGMPVTAVWPLDYMKKVGHQRFQTKPVGTGPYMVSKWAHGKYVDLVRNPVYWDASRAGYVDRIHLPIIPASRDQWRAFREGAIDMTSAPGDSAPGHSGRIDVAAVEDDPHVKSGAWMATRWPLLCVAYVGLNQRSTQLGGAENLTLRQALACSTDSRGLVDATLEGIPVEAKGFVPDGIPGAGLTGPAYPYDPDRARELAGRSADDASIDCWYRAEPGYKSISAALRDGWAKAGIRVAVSEYEWGTLFGKLAEGKEDELFILGWMYDYPSVDDFLYPLFHSDYSRTGSLTGYSNPEVDRLLDQARATTDTAARLRTYARAEKLILTDVAVIPLYFYRDYRVCNSRVQDQVLNPLGLVDMWRVWVR
jgi:oligopeptide transport system substrate-binding protein